MEVDVSHRQNINRLRGRKSQENYFGDCSEPTIWKNKQNNNNDSKKQVKKEKSRIRRKL